MYYDKAFEQMQKAGDRVMALPQQSNVDCLYDLHYKYALSPIAIVTHATMFTATASTCALQLSPRPSRRQL